MRDTAAMTSSYPYDPAWEHERGRLRALEQLLDPATARAFDAIGVSAGWRCLEIGAGAGSIASMLAERVGPAGHVVATDVDTRFLEPLGGASIEVRLHDITTDALECEAFDLVHARLVLGFLPQRNVAIARALSALRPGGWLVIEDLDVASGQLKHALPRSFEPAGVRISAAVLAVFEGAGFDVDLGGDLPFRFAELGLEDVGGEWRSVLIRGETSMVFYRLSFEQLTPAMQTTGQIEPGEIECALAWCDDPGAAAMSPPVMTAWGRKSRQVHAARAAKDDGEG